MKIEELENQLETLKNNVAKLENTIAEIKRNEDRKNKIPDDVKDIPNAYPLGDYEKYGIRNREIHRFVYLMDNYEIKIKNKTLGENDIVNNTMLFPTKEFAEMFREKAQLIADCLLFKWLYDREYVPKWEINHENWYVYYNTEKERYEYDYYSVLNINAVYFSSEEIADKCSDWLNYKYFGIYNPKEGENNDNN